jgi:hypothetical protein
MNTEEWKPIESAQDAFDRVVKHLSTQSGRAHRHGVCAYFIPESGARCAIGALMPTPLLRYEGSFDGLVRSLPGLVATFDPSGVLSRVDFRGHSLGMSLQRLHDSPLNWHDDKFVAWKAAANIARDFSLGEAAIAAIGSQA